MPIRYSRVSGLLLLGWLLLLPWGNPHAASFKKEMDFAVDLAEKGLWNEAAHRFLALLKRQPHNPRLWNDLAVSYEAMGEYEKAHEAYDKAVSLMAYPPSAMLANQEAFEAFYRTWQEPSVAEQPPLVDPRTAPPRPVKPTLPVFPGPDFDDDDAKDEPEPDTGDDEPMAAPYPTGSETPARDEDPGSDETPAEDLPAPEPVDDEEPPA